MFFRVCLQDIYSFCGLEEMYWLGDSCVCGGKWGTGRVLVWRWGCRRRLEDGKEIYALYATCLLDVFCDLLSVGWVYRL